mgnify:CR=1 FL=1
MMTKEERDVVKTVYTRFLESEEERWTEIDDNLEFVDYLSDAELIKECLVKYTRHFGGVFRCIQDHSQENCFAPYILEAVEAILKLFEETEDLHENNRYILTYYLVMSELKMIYSY